MNKRVSAQPRHTTTGTSPSLPETPHLGPVLDEEQNRESFGSHELAIILSHYQLNVIEQIQELPIGSRHSPKVLIRTQEGNYLLKRRASGRDDPYRVAFAHHLMLHLASQNFPVPRLFGTRENNNSMVQFVGRSYELFEYVAGERYDRSAPAAYQAGATLARLHDILSSWHYKYKPPSGSYHASKEIDAKLSVIPAMVDAVTPDLDNQALSRTCDYLSHMYWQAAEKVNQCGYGALAVVILHGDWHPGNLLFRNEGVNAVLDFDSARYEPRIADLANAALQFSMKMSTTENVTVWPEGLEISLLASVVKGYDEQAETSLTSEELEALPWLIIEALITESVLPIAATGSFAHLDGATFLEMIGRKIKWIAPRAAKLTAYLKGQQR
ncbi:MAG: phosphotransferase [Planctomycetes bacterium]|nr:phosphotransferase [Planctomycetota bacterium]MCH7603320.1 phosphotransferase [Planctomycetota bacterium]